MAASATICGAPLGIARAHASVVLGIEAHPIEVEVSSTRGPAFFQLVGLAEAAVREARVRVASALAKFGVLLDEYAITVNLAPADLRKAGAALDVAIAAAVLGAIGRVPSGPLDEVLLLGELALDGSVRPVRGLLPQLQGALGRGFSRAIVPAPNAREAGLVGDLDVRLASTLADVVDQLTEVRWLPRAPRFAYEAAPSAAGFDLSDVKGQVTAKRALEIAAAGGHNLLLIGPPGSGKTMLARILPSIMPPLNFDEALACTAIHSVAGLLAPEQGVVQVRPFRAPHHSVSDVGLVGGGDVPRPGEVSLAHHGVLFLDELAEFRRTALEALRQPLEDGTVSISRARGRAWFPARPLVVGAVNPCPCGYAGHPTRSCRCDIKMRKRYLSRLSGPLLDRLDIHVSVPAVEVRSLVARGGGESSATVRSRVMEARERQRRRGPRVNAELGLTELERAAALDAESQLLVTNAVEQLGLSARAYGKVLKVARTIADLEGEAGVRAPHVAEAIQGRLLDRTMVGQGP
jgi:magnesium chelatase family protein